MLRAKAPRVEAMSSQASLLNLSLRLLVVSCRYTTTALPVRCLDVSFPRSSKNLTFDGQYQGESTACNAWGSASFSFKSHQDEQKYQEEAPFCHSSHAHTWDCSAWLISQCLGNHWPPRRKGCSKLYVDVNWWSPWCIPPRPAVQGRALSFPAFAQPSSVPSWLLHEHVHGEARKEPWMRAWRTSTTTLPVLNKSNQF